MIRTQDGLKPLKSALSDAAIPQCISVQSDPTAGIATRYPRA